MTIEEQLIRDEGLKLFAYPDSLGYITIGVGRCIDHRKGEGITQDEAKMLLSNDVSRVKAELGQKLPWFTKLDDVRQATLVNMAFNLGVPGLLAFHDTLSLIGAGKYSEASQAMLDSHWATQVGDRAHRLAQQMASGVWV